MPLTDRLIAVNSAVLHLQSLLDALLSPHDNKAQGSLQYNTLVVRVHKAFADVSSELKTLEMLLDGEFQETIDNLKQTILNLSLFSKLGLGLAVDTVVDA